MCVSRKGGRMTSESISQIIDGLESFKKDYDYNLLMMKKCDDETQDYLHKLELEKLTQNQKAKISTALAKIRKERRIYKDKLEELECCVEFSEKDYTLATINSLKQVLGKVRKVERKRNNRIYKNRVLEI